MSAQEALSRATALNDADNGEVAASEAQTAVDLFLKANDVLMAGKALLALVKAYNLTEEFDKASQAVSTFLEPMKKGRGGKGDLVGVPFGLWAAAEVSLAKGRAGEALKQAKEAVSLIETVFPDKTTLPQVNCLIVRIHVETRSAAEALDTAQRAITQAKQSNDNHTIGQAFYMLMIANILAEKMDPVVILGKQALEIFEQLGDKKHQGLVLMGMLQGNVHQIDVVRTAKKALKLMKEAGCVLEEAGALDFLVRYQLACGETSRALSTATSCLQDIRESGNTKATMKALQSVAMSMVACKKKADAVSTGVEALSLARKIGNKKLEVDWLVHTSSLSAMAGQFDQARSYAQEAQTLAQEMGDKRLERDVAVLIKDVDDSEKKAPEAKDQKSEAQLCLRRLVDALESKDTESFQEQVELLKQNPFATSEEIQAALEPIIRKDPDVYADFLAGVGKVKDRGGGLLFLDRNFVHFLIRMGGMGYGPHFRMLDMGWRKIGEHGDDILDREGMQAMSFHSGTQGWEAEVYSHAGTLDSGLMCMGFRGFPVTNLKTKLSQGLIQ